MAKRRHELDTRVFTIFLLIAIPFVAFGSIVVVTMARGALHDSVGGLDENRREPLVCIDMVRELGKLSYNFV